MPSAALPPLLYLSSADIAALQPGPAEAHLAVEHVFRLKAAGRTRMAPKTAVPLHQTDAAMAMVGLMEEPPVAGVKWVGVVADNPARGLPNINGMIILSDSDTGLPRAILDAGWITATRTAACTGVVAAKLARPGSDSAGFVGCGLQAHANLDALRLVLPDLARVRIFGRGSASTARFAARVQELGLKAEVVATAREAVSDVDVVVTSVPPAPGFTPFLEAGWTRPDAFIAAVDLGRSWQPATWRPALAQVITDDIAQSTALIAQGKLLDGGPFDGEIGDLLQPDRAAPLGRSALLFAGSALADVSLAALLESRARAAGLGLELPR